jgi:hypothetical protein
MAGRECPQCGEPLMGAVNRCWKCGIDLRAESRPGMPPVSRNSFEPLVVAELADEQKPAEVQPFGINPAAPLSPLPDGPSPAPSSAAPLYAPAVPDPGEPAIGAESPVLEFGPNGSLLRRGSPFAAGSMLLPPQQSPEFSGASRRIPPTLQQAHAASGGAIAALVLGIFGVCLAPIRFEGAIVGVIGLAMGIWGLYSQRRGWALLGLILCCLAIAIGMYTGVYWLFLMTKQANPWEY